MGDDISGASVTLDGIATYSSEEPTCQLRWKRQPGKGVRLLLEQKWLIRTALSAREEWRPLPITEE